LASFNGSLRPPRDRRMTWLDIYLVVLFLALVGLLVAKFRG
jgi:hypothetical protein